MATEALVVVVSEATPVALVFQGRDMQVEGAFTKHQARFCLEALEAVEVLAKLGLMAL
jgi:hypothetical protein